MYTAAVLTQESRSRLMQLFADLFNANEHGYVFETANGGILPHHMTINLGPFDGELNKPLMYGCPVVLQASEFFVAKNLNVCALKIDTAEVWTEIGLIPIRTINDSSSHKHITLCVRPPGKPFLSNKIDWDLEPFADRPIHLNAVIMECD